MNYGHLIIRLRMINVEDVIKLPQKTVALKRNRNSNLGFADNMVLLDESLKPIRLAWKAVLRISW